MSADVRVSLPVCLIVAIAAGALPAACSRDASGAPPAARQPAAAAAAAAAPTMSTGRAAIAADATEPDDGQWIRPAKDYASSRYSGSRLLARIANSSGEAPP